MVKIRCAGTFEFIRNQPGQQYADQFIMTHQWAYAIGQIAASYYGGPYGAAAWSSYYAYVGTGSVSAGVRAGVTTYISSELSSGVDSYYGDTWSWGRVMANSFVGGINSTLQGGKFVDGFKFSAVTSTARFAYNDVVKYDTTWKEGGDAINKDEFQMPEKGAINIGTAGKVDPNSWWGEGGIVSRALNYIPGVNAVSGLHDVFQIRLDQWGGNFARNALNVPGMLPASVITFTALFDGIPGMALMDARIQKEKYTADR